MDASSITMIGRARSEVIRELREAISAAEKAIKKKEKVEASDLYHIHYAKENLKEQSKRLFEFKDLQDYALNIINKINELEELVRNTLGFQSKLITNLEDFERELSEEEAAEKKKQERLARRGGIERKAKPIRISSNTLDFRLAQIKQFLEVLINSYEAVDAKLKELISLENTANQITIKMNADFTFILKSIKNVERKLKDIEEYAKRLEKFLIAQGSLIKKKPLRIILPTLPKINLLIKEDKSLADEVYIINSVGEIKTKLSAYKLYTPKGKSMYDTLMEDLLLLDKLHGQLSREKSDAKRLLQNISQVEGLEKGNELGPQGREMIEHEINAIIRQVEIELEEIYELVHRIRKNMALFEHVIAYFEKILNYITNEQDKRLKEIPNTQQLVYEILNYLKGFGLFFSEEMKQLEKLS